MPVTGPPFADGCVILTDDNGDDHESTFETFNFRDECLTLARHKSKRSEIVAAA
ncbi:MAG: hypothetical protein RL088_2082 [Verrucomicrobiota bacterium]|jgi:hypothetical protein